MFGNSSSSLNKKNTHKPKPQSGFGLVELMVSISIMVLVSAIMLTNQSSFNGSILLRSQAYEIALQLREIQLSAVSASSNGSGDFHSVLGVHFDSTSANNNIYNIFKDSSSGSNSNGFYDSGEAFGIQGIVDRRFEIREIRAIGTDTISGYAVSVVFERPNFDARFFDSSGELTNTSSIEIDIARRGVTGVGVGVLRTVEITSAGQIAVQ